jgi:hypothetical protein
MPASKRHRQLQLDLSSFTWSTSPIVLSFQMNRRPVKGTLYGNCLNWTFESNSPAFLRYIPSGKLDKYALWINAVPPVISELYNKIYEAALKSGYSLQEKED